MTTPDATGPPAILRVAATSNVPNLAQMIAHGIRHQGHAEMCAVGAGAVNQAVKACAAARSHLAPSDVDIIVTPSFIDIGLNGEERTAIRFLCEGRRIHR